MTVGGGWWAFKAFAEEAREMQRDSEIIEARICPVCGNTLTINARGEGSCDVGHYRTSNVVRGEY